MLKTLRVRAHTLWGQMRARRTWSFLGWSVSGGLALGCWLIWPLIQNPVVRVYGVAVSIPVKCVPHTIEIKTVRSYSDLTSAKLTISAVDPQLAPAAYTLQVIPQRNEQNATFLLALTADQQSSAIDYIAALSDAARLNLSAEFTSALYVDIQSIGFTPSSNSRNIGCTPGALMGGDLQKEITTSRTELLGVILPQEQLGDFIRAVNDTAGGILVGALLLTILWLCSQLTAGMYKLYLLPIDELLQNIDPKATMPAGRRSRARTREKIRGEFELLCRRLSFVRTLGPAMGFLLTVSSLISGLHPSSYQTPGSFLFVTSLQLALVATFLGLLARVIAEFAIRVNQSAYERALDRAYRA